jgi:hypothetical protein
MSYDNINFSLLFSRRKSSHVTVIRLGSSQEGQPEISSTEKPSTNIEKPSTNIEKTSANVEKMPTQDQKCVTVVSTNPDAVFKIPPPPLTTMTAMTATATTVSGIPLLPPPPGSSKTRTTGNNHQVGFHFLQTEYEF